MSLSKSKIASTLYFSDYWNTDSIWKWSLVGLGFVTQKQALDELLDANIYEYSKQHYEYFAHELRHSVQDNDSFETDVSIYLNELK
jgi:hypothetical protein